MIFTIETFPVLQWCLFVTQPIHKWLGPKFKHILMSSGPCHSGNDDLKRWNLSRLYSDVYLSSNLFIRSHGYGWRRKHKYLLDSKLLGTNWVSRCPAGGPPYGSQHDVSISSTMMYMFYPCRTRILTAYLVCAGPSMGPMWSQVGYATKTFTFPMGPTIRVPLSIYILGLLRPMLHDMFGNMLVRLAWYVTLITCLV